MQASIPRSMQARAAQCSTPKGSVCARACVRVCVCVCLGGGLYRTRAGFAWLGLTGEVRVGELRLRLACDLHEKCS
jgi:hypothetical protein